MSILFKYFKHNPAVIQLAVLLYIRYPLSLRQVEDMLFERGIDISHETIRLWWNRFGSCIAAKIRKKRRFHPKQYSPWRWHIDEVFVKIAGKTHYLWRAVDHEGEVLDVVVTKRRDKKAALRVLGCSHKQEVGGLLKNRAENSHLPLRRRERAMQGFRKAETLQKFTSVHSQIYNHFNGEQHLIDRQTFKKFRSEPMTEWRLLAA